jgi:hypothetical protein
VLNQVRKQLSEVSAKQVAAQDAHLITTIDSPETGPYPVGLGRVMVVVLGTMGGLVMGLAWLFLNLPTAENTTVVQTQIVPVKADEPWLKPVPAKKPESTFDFSAYSKKAREPMTELTANRDPAKSSPNPGVVVGTSLGGSGLSQGSPSSVMPS